MNPYINAAKNYTEKPNLALFKRHTHDNYEIFCFLSGDAKYFVEGNIYDLKPNDILIIKKSETHALLINKAVPYTRYVVNFNEAALLDTQAEELLALINKKPLGLSNRISSTDSEKSNWLHYLDRIVNAPVFQDKRLYLTVLFHELCKNINKPEPESDFVTKTQEIIEYINKNLTTISTLDDICEQFYISKTHLNRKFKAITGTTVWDYILTKRLITAKDMLINGYRPNIVSEKCGWEEYSSFYRAYKLHFGVAPKEDFHK